MVLVRLSRRGFGDPADVLERVGGVTKSEG
jgi:hypothetical protein